MSYQQPQLVVIRAQDLLTFCVQIQEHGEGGYAIARLDPAMPPVEQFGGWYQCFMRLRTEPHPEDHLVESSDGTAGPTGG